MKLCDITYTVTCLQMEAIVRFICLIIARFHLLFKIFHFLGYFWVSGHEQEKMKLGTIPCGSRFIVVMLVLALLFAVLLVITPKFHFNSTE